MDIKQQFKDKPLATVSTIVGVITGIISIVTAGTFAVNTARETIVFKEDLTASETRIIQRIRKEAVLTRGVVIGELQERKDNLMRELEDTADAGKVAQLLEEIDVLNKRIDRIRGTNE